MIVPARSLLLLGALATSAAAQTTTTTVHRSVHPTTTSLAAVANPADNPPNVPVIVGTPKPLYALRYVDTLIGTGPLAEPQKFYTVRYTGWLTDGTKFDSSDDSPGKDPITFPYGARRVIIGWDTGFTGMHVGGKRRLYIPYQLAYGETGRPPIPPRSDLIFDVELVSISDTPPPDPNAPPAAPPASSAPTSAPLPNGAPTPPASTPPPKPETTPQP